MNKPLELFQEEYDGESIVDVGRAVYEAFNKDFNPLMAGVPKDEDGFLQGLFIVTIEWVSELDTDVSSAPNEPRA